MCNFLVLNFCTQGFLWGFFFARKLEYCERFSRLERAVFRGICGEILALFQVCVGNFDTIPPWKVVRTLYLWRQIGDKIDTQISWPWKHFFASKIVLRVIVCCLRGVGSMSSSRRIPRFIVVFSSGHRWLFFVASLWAYVIVASFLCLRVVGSSFRLRYIHCTDFTYLVTLLPYCSVPLLLCCHFFKF